MKIVMTPVPSFSTTTLILLIVFFSIIPQASTGNQWQPTPLPTDHHGDVHIFILVMDNSESMLKGKKPSSRSRSTAFFAISELPLGTYTIIISLGTESEIIAEEYLHTNQDKIPLQQIIKKIRMDDDLTDVDKLEKLLGQTQEALEKYFSSQNIHLEIKILTDGVPDPGENSNSSVKFSNLLGQPTSHTELGGGLQVYSLEFQYSAMQRKKAIKSANDHVTLTTAEIKRSIADKMDFENQQSPDQDETTPDSIFNERWVRYLIAAIIVLLIISFISLFRRYRQWLFKGKQTTNNPYNNKHILEVPTGLSITEWKTDEDGLQRVEGSHTISWLPRVPVIFGSDTTLSTVVLTAFNTPKQLCKIILDGNGTATITSLNGGLIFNDKKITRPVQFFANGQNTIIYGSSKIEIEPIILNSKSEEVLFGRTTAKKTNEPIITTQ